jgi:hypothetical protein
VIPDEVEQVVSEYAGLCIDMHVDEILISADSDVGRPSRYGVVDTDHPCGVASGGPLGNQIAEQIGGSARRRVWVRLVSVVASLSQAAVCGCEP